MTVLRVRVAGERAVVLDCGARAAGVASGARELADRLGVRLVDVVPGAETVLVVAANPVHLQCFLDAVPQLDPVGPSAETGEVVEIPARYDGPDLADVAAAAGLSVAEVIARHSAVTYEAAFTGFAPGFAYLSGLDPALRMPRRSSPRPRVAPGSVAIADTYTAVYPRPSPGGWHLLGTTDVTLFDAARAAPALIAPGSRVRFVPLP
jgi:KipI family sensor histidine kinase inhibitor